MTPPIPEDELLDDLRRVALEVGHTPRRDDIDQLGRHASETYRRRFGTINRAQEAAGLRPNTSKVQPLPEGLAEEDSLEPPFSPADAERVLLRYGWEHDDRAMLWRWGGMLVLPEHFVRSRADQVVHIARALASFENGDRR